MTLRRITREMQNSLCKASCISRTWHLWCFLILLVSFQQHARGQNATQLKTWRSFHLFQHEQKNHARNLARAVENRVHRVEEDPANWTCQCAYHQCGDFFLGPGKCYHLDSPLEKSTCPRDHVNCSPSLLYPDQSFVRIPPAVNPGALMGQSLESKYADVVDDICMLQGLEKEGNSGIFQKAKRGRVDSGWVFTGTTSGVYWSWPGQRWDTDVSRLGTQCAPFDPRLRSWYLPSISPMKIMIILNDVAVGEAADETISKHLLTLGSNDYMSVISYDASISTSLDGKGVLQEPYRLWRATDSNMVAANEEGRRRRPVGMNAAFHIAFNMTGEPSVDSLDKVFIFLSGSSAEPKVADEVLKSVKKMQPIGTWANVLTYTIMPEGAGQRVDHQFARKLACQNRGIWTHVPRSDEPDTSAYMSLIALPAEFLSTKSDFVYFSPIYEDNSNLGDVVSVSKGYYSNCETSPVGPKRIFTGVVGIDVKVVDLKRAGILEKYEEFQNLSIPRGLSVRNVKNIGCQLQWIREKSNSQCSEENGCELNNKCRMKSLNLQKPEPIFCNWLQDPGPEHTNASICCNKQDTARTCEMYQASLLSAAPEENFPKKLQKGGIEDNWKIVLVVVPVAVAIGVFVSVLLFRKQNKKPPPEISTTTEDYIGMGKIVGEGSGGVVYAHKVDGQLTAVKVFTNAMQASSEKEIHHKLPPHPNIIKCFEASSATVGGLPEEMCIIMELMDMDLSQYINDPKQRHKHTYKDLIHIFIGIASGLEHLHANGVMHRDLKPQNILLKVNKGQPSVQLSDFGHSRRYRSDSWNLSVVRGTLKYMSPEMERFWKEPWNLRTQIGFTTDIFSLGVTMCYCIVGSTDFESYRWFIPSSFSKLISKCRHPDTTRRPTAGKIRKKLIPILSSPLASEKVFA